MGNILKRYNGTNWESVSGAITGDTLPIGAIVAYSSNNAPTNWLICDGSAINRFTYAELFSVIGTTYGSGDGTTTFNLPNAKGRTIVGLDSSQTEFNAMGKTGGSKYLQEHDHTIGTSMSQFANFTVVSGGGGVTPYFNENNKSGIAGTGDSGNLQPYLTENVIIKAFQSSGVVANVAQTKKTSDTDTYSCNYINNLNTYSTEEKVIGKWIDGKPIYRKVITGLTFTPKPAGEIYTNSYLTVVEQLIDVKMTRSGSTAVAVCSANHPQNGNTMNIFAITEFSNCDTLILEFTKTTD